MGYGSCARCGYQFFGYLYRRIVITGFGHQEVVCAACAVQIEEEIEELKR